MISERFPYDKRPLIDYVLYVMDWKFWGMVYWLETENNAFPIRPRPILVTAETMAMTRY